jgi:hypothetical protein
MSARCMLLSYYMVLLFIPAKHRSCLQILPLTFNLWIELQSSTFFCCSLLHISSFLSFSQKCLCFAQLPLLLSSLHFTAMSERECDHDLCVVVKKEHEIDDILPVFSPHIRLTHFSACECVRVKLFHNFV